MGEQKKKKHADLQKEFEDIEHTAKEHEKKHAGDVEKLLREVEQKKETVEEDEGHHEREEAREEEE